jgi:4a-hydroxytetrahydrobiopterin dehydratase
MRDGSQPSARSLLAELTAERWYLWGALSEPEPEFDRGLEDLGVRVARVPGTGHAMGLQNPAGLASTIAGIVDGGWPRGGRRGQDGRVPERLTADEVAAALQGLPHWSGDADGLRRTVELPSFRDAVTAITRIADVAEELDHHPDVDLRWRTLHLTLVTHSAGGVTANDVDLARRIDALLPG